MTDQQQDAARDGREVTEAVEVYLSLGRVNRLLRRSASLGELSPGAASALATVVRGGRMRQGDLAAQEQVAAPTMSRIVAVLEEQGYVSRVPDPDDGRAALVAATATGEELVTGVTSVRTQELGRVLEELSPSQRRGLVRGLLALERAFQA